MSLFEQNSTKLFQGRTSSFLRIINVEKLRRRNIVLWPNIMALSQNYCPGISLFSPIFKACEASEFMVMASRQRHIFYSINTSQHETYTYTWHWLFYLIILRKKPSIRHRVVNIINLGHCTILTWETKSHPNPSGDSWGAILTWKVVSKCRANSPKIPSSPPNVSPGIVPDIQFILTLPLP